MNEAKVRERQARGERAEALLRNELLNDAFEHLETQFIDAWKNSPVSDTDSRERLYQLCQNLSAVRGYLQSVVTDGKLAKSQLDELQSRPRNHIKRI
jgi:hypothetical protein